MMRFDEKGIRTVMTVLITPLLLAVCVFFLVHFYNDGQLVKDRQGKILIELGKISMQLHQINNDITTVKKTVAMNQSEIMELWKSKK